MKITRIGFALASLLISATLAPASAAEAKHVAVTAIVEHPALDAVRDGIKDALADAGFKGDALTFTYESAQGSPATAAQIARRFVGDEPDVIVAIATPSAQAAAAATQDIPVVFSAVTDPVGAKLVTNMDKPGANITGVSDMLAIDQQLDLMKEIMPGLKTIGVPFNPGEANAASLVEALKDIAPTRGLTVVTAAANKSSDVMGATQSLVGKVDAFYTLTDNTIVTALESVIKVGIDNQVPVFAADTDSVGRGAIAALGFDYYDVGRQTGAVVVRILNGEKPGAIAARRASASNLYVNPKAAAAMGITLPEAVVARASKVIE